MVKTTTSFAESLRQVRGDADLTQEKAVAILNDRGVGLSLGTYRNYESGGEPRDYDPDEILSILRYYVEQKEIKGGGQEALPDMAELLRSDKTGKFEINGFVFWRFHPQQRRGDAGPGAVQDVASEETETIIRHKSEIRHLTGYSADVLEPFFVAGDSMEPLIKANTPVLYLPQEKEGFTVPGIYVISVNGQERVKRVDPRGGGALRLISENEDYKDEVFIPLEDADTDNMYRSEENDLATKIRVIGRIVVYTVST